jgi:quercetin dioxygenase-like cupin family protein
MLKRLTMISVSVLGASCSGAQPSPSLTNQAPVAASEVARKVLQQTPASEGQELRLMLIEYPPGTSAPAHRHPAVGLCYIIEGMAESQYEGEETRIFRAGDSYQDSATKDHLYWRNPSETSPLRFICAAQLAVGQEFAVPIR